MSPRSRLRDSVQRAAASFLIVASAGLGSQAATPAAAQVLMREREVGASDVAPSTPCLLTTNTNGSAANYRWYNLCAGYIWIYDDWEVGEGIGVLFGGPEQPAVIAGNTVKRVITYYRNTVQVYSCRIGVSLHTDGEGDGCPDSLLDSECIEPGLRWNCSEFGAPIPDGSSFLIVKQAKVPNHGANIVPSFATDGPFSSECSPWGTAPRSFYYSASGGCQPWVGPSCRYDNFLTWLIVDGTNVAPNASSRWDQVKGIYR